MRWNEKFRIGNEEIDDHHKELITMANKLQQALRRGTECNEVIDTLKFIVHFTRHHFPAEEAVMSQINYPGLANHKALHEHLLKKISGIFIDLRDGKKINCFELVTFLTDWIMDHIIVEDSQIGVYMLMHQDEPDFRCYSAYIKKNIEDIKSSIERVKSLYNRGLIDINEFKESKQNIFTGFVSTRSLKQFNETFDILEGVERENIITEKEKHSFLLTKLTIEDVKETLAEISCIDGKLRAIKLLVKTLTITKEESSKYIPSLLEFI